MSEYIDRDGDKFSAGLSLSGQTIGISLNGEHVVGFYKEDANEIIKLIREAAK